MSDYHLGSLARIDPRTVWVSEPYDFTPWLRENIHLLAEALGLEIDLDVRQEVAVGGFSADLLGYEVGTRAVVVIENQLEQTDHSHLGQLLTYAGGLDAAVLVWISTKVREEHQQALTWLNQRTPEDTAFFGVEIELLSIDGSPPAPHFKIVAAPNEWQKAKATAVAAPSERGERYKAFWREFLTELLAVDPGATNASADRAWGDSWFGFPIGRSYFGVYASFGSDGNEPVFRVQLVIEGAEKEQNEAILALWAQDRNTIEQELGEAARWEARPDIKRSYVTIQRPGSLDDEDLHSQLRAWGVPRVIAMRKTFGPRAKALALPLPVTGHAPQTESQSSTPSAINPRM